MAETPIAALVERATWPLARYQIIDALINTALYVPVGACAYLVLRRRHSPSQAALYSVLLGFGTSLTIEVIQLFDVGRQASLLDLIWNSVGSTIGVLFGILISHSSHRLQPENRNPIFVLTCWLTYLLFPFLPVVAGPALDAKFATFLHYDSVSLVSCFTSWYVSGFLLKEAGVQRVNFWLVRSIALVLVQMLLPGRQPSVAGLFGAILGTSLFAQTRRLTPAWPLLLTLVVRGLAPFHFQPTANAFAWVPFAPVVEGYWLNASLVLLEKLYYYAATIWALASAGLRLRNAAFITAALLVAMETAQLHLPGRTPETTDPVIALLVGIVFDALRRTSIPSETSA